MTGSCISGHFPLGFGQALPLWECWHDFTSRLHVCALLFSPAQTLDFCFGSIPCLSLFFSSNFAILSEDSTLTFAALDHFPISFCSCSVLNPPGATVSMMKRLGQVTGVHRIISQFYSEIRTDTPRCGLSTWDSNTNFTVLDEKPRCKTSLKKQNLNGLPVLHIRCRAVL